MPKAGRECTFCGEAAAVRSHSGLFHPLKADHGPFDFYLCTACGSGLTLDAPSSESLTALYSSFDDGLPELNREIMKDDPQSALYELCARRMIAWPREGAAMSWIDVGAGGGELSEILHRLLPDTTGTALDLHEKPARLADKPRVRWVQADLNTEAFAEKSGLAGSADWVISTAVWEHVSRPDAYARELLKLLKPGGIVYLLCPDYGSAARKLMGSKWPYFTPGEHLNMPTARGAEACLSRQWATVHDATPAPSVRSAPLSLPYSFRYVLRRFRLDALGRMLPPGLGMPLPAGALESVLVAPA